MRFIGYHAKILLRGLVRVVWGGLILRLICAVVTGFEIVLSEFGYIAVYNFLVAVCLLLVSLLGIYLLGVGPFCKPRR